MVLEIFTCFTVVPPLVTVRALASVARCFSLHLFLVIFSDYPLIATMLAAHILNAICICWARRFIVPWLTAIATANGSLATVMTNRHVIVSCLNYTYIIHIIFYRVYNKVVKKMSIELMVLSR